MSTVQTQSASIKVNIFEVMPFHEVYPGLGFPKNFWDIQYQCVHYSGWRVQEMVLQDPTSSWFAFWLCEGSLHSDVEGVSGMYMLVTSKYQHLASTQVDRRRLGQHQQLVPSLTRSWIGECIGLRIARLSDRFWNRHYMHIRTGYLYLDRWNTRLAWPRSWSDSWKSWSISVLIFPIMPASSVGGIPVLNGRWSRATCTFKTSSPTSGILSASAGASIAGVGGAAIGGCRLWT